LAREAFGLHRKGSLADIGHPIYSNIHDALFSLDKKGLQKPDFGDGKILVELLFTQEVYALNLLE
jgi:hypothetical protein